jgi:hypothetical protein
VHRFDRRGPREGRAAVADGVDQRAEGEDVRAGVDGASLHLLRRHVGSGAEDRQRRGVALGRRAGACRRRVRAFGRRLCDPLGELGDPEVDDLRIAAARHDQVLRLQVAVHDAGGVGAGQAVGDARQQLEDRGAVARGTGPDRQRLPFHELHGHVVQRPFDTGVVDADDGRVVERRGHARLAEEALDAQRIGGPVGRQDFQRHAPAERFIHRFVDLPHPARTNRTRDAIAPEPGPRCHRRGHLREHTDAGRFGWQRVVRKDQS